MPRRQRGDTSSTLVVRTNYCPASESGDCAALKAQKGRFESDAGHQFGGSRWGGVIPCKDDVLGSIPRCSTKFIPVKRTGCVHPTVNRTAAGSNPATGANLPRSSTGQDTGFSARRNGIDTHTRLQFLPVAQPDEHRATNAEDAGSTPAGKANSSGCRGAQSSPPALEAGERWCESNHPDHSMP